MSALSIDVNASNDDSLSIAWFEDAFQGLMSVNESLNESTQGSKPTEMLDVIANRLSKTEQAKRDALEQVAIDKKLLIARVDELSINLTQTKRNLTRYLNILTDQERKLKLNDRAIQSRCDNIRKNIKSFEDTRRKLHGKMKQMKWTVKNNFTLAVLSHISDRSGKKSYFGESTCPAELASCVPGHLGVYCLAKATFENVRKMQVEIAVNIREAENQLKSRKRLQDLITTRKQELLSINQLDIAIDKRFGQDIKRYRQANMKEMRKSDTDEKKWNRIAPFSPSKSNHYTQIKHKYLRTLNLTEDINVESLDLNYELENLLSTENEDVSSSWGVLQDEAIKGDSHWITNNDIQKKKLITEKKSGLHRVWDELDIVSESIDEAKMSQQMAWEELEQVLDRRERLVTYSHKLNN